LQTEWYNQTNTIISSPRMETYHFDKLKRLIEKSNVSKLDRLLKRITKLNINLNDITVHSRSLLSYATQAASVEGVNCLIYNGINVNNQDTNGHHALWIACEAYHSCKQIDKSTKYYQIIKTLIIHKSNCNIQSKINSYYTCLMHICGTVKPESDSASHIEMTTDIIRLLLDNGASSFITNASGQTARDIAFRSFNLEYVSFMDAYIARSINSSQLPPNTDPSSNQPKSTHIVPTHSKSQSDIRDWLKPIIPAAPAVPIAPAVPVTPVVQIDPDQQYHDKKKKLEQSIVISNLELQLATSMLAIEKVNDELRQLRDRSQAHTEPKCV